MRGFNDVRRETETQHQRNAKQKNYDYIEKSYKRDTKKNSDARLNFKRPLYHLKGKDNDRKRNNVSIDNENMECSKE